MAHFKKPPLKQTRCHNQQRCKRQQSSHWPSPRWQQKNGDDPLQEAGRQQARFHAQEGNRRHNSKCAAGGAEEIGTINPSGRQTRRRKQHTQNETTEGKRHGIKQCERHEAKKGRNEFSARGELLVPDAGVTKQQRHPDCGNYKERRPEIDGFVELLQEARKPAAQQGAGEGEAQHG